MSELIHPDRLSFWKAVDRLVDEHPVVIDRPAGFAHPRFPQIVYPLDYGYLDGTRAMDGDGIDVWLGRQGGSTVTGIVMTVDLHKNDAELKILIGCTQEEMRIIEAHHNGLSQYGQLLARAEHEPV